MSDKPVDEVKYNRLIEKLHKTTETLASAVTSNPLGRIEAAQIEIDDMYDDDNLEPDLSIDDIREINKASVFEVPDHRGNIIYLSLDRSKVRIKNKLPAWTESLKTKGTVVDGVLISTKPKFKSKIRKLIQKLNDGDLKLPVKLNTTSGWVELDETKLRNMYDAIESHDQKCEEREQEIWNAINDAGDIGTIVNILVDNKIKL